MPNIVHRIKKVIAGIELSSFTAGMLFGALVYAGLSRYGAEVATSLNTIATVALAIVGVHGIKSWRSIYIEKKKHEAAESLVINFSNAVSFFEHMTGCFVSFEKPIQDENYEENLITNRGKALSKRHRSAFKCFKKIEDMQFYYACVLGDDAKQVCKELLKLYNQYDQYIAQYVDISIRLYNDKKVYGVDDLEDYPSTRNLMHQYEEEINEAKHFLYNIRNSPLFNKIEELIAVTEKIQKNNMMK